MKKYSHEDVDELRDALFGRSVVSVTMNPEPFTFSNYGPSVQGEVHLDDGSVLLLAGNDGGCSCGGGDYDLIMLNSMPINGITNVEVEDGFSTKDDYGYGSQIYRIFVIAQDERLQLAQFEGDDGSGYYGTGFWFSIAPPKENRDA